MWEFFTREEFACKCGCGTNEIDPVFVGQLDELRRRCGFPLGVTSGYRCENHPVEADKEKPGMHHSGRAADLAFRNGSERFVLLREAFAMGVFQGIGTGKSFIHVDTRESGTSWGY